MRVVKTGLVVAAMTLSAVVSAQSTGKGKSAEDRAQQKTERMAEELSLTEEQKSKVLALNLEAAKQHEEIRNNASLTDEQKKEKMKGIHRETKAKVDALLTEEQRAKAKAKHEEMREHRSDKGTPEERAQRHADRMAEELSLTDDQKSKLIDLHLRIDKKMEAIRANDQLTDEQRKAEMKAVHAEKRKELKNILTEEQLKELKEKKHHGEEDDE